MYYKDVFTWLLAFFSVVTHALSSASKNFEITSQLKISDASGSIANNYKIICETPFYPVGSYCLLIDNRILGTWSEMRDICQLFGGDLVNMQDANILYDISNYIQNHELTNVSYWVGASNKNSDGIWEWSSDSSPVRMGTPLWGHLYGQEPNGNGNENCTIISKSEFYFMHDEDCDFASHGVICQPASVGLGFMIDSPDNKQPKECPPQFDAVWGTCLLEYHEQYFNYSEAISFCESYTSHLVKIDDANFYGALYDYIVEKGGYPFYWIDGSDETTEGEWLFSDGTPVKRGTPFWTVLTEDIQAPSVKATYNYISIFISMGYLFFDTIDYDLNHVICQIDI